jgi:hypothetical protein
MLTDSPTPAAPRSRPHHQQEAGESVPISPTPAAPRSCSLTPAAPRPQPHDDQEAGEILTISPTLAAPRRVAAPSQPRRSPRSQPHARSPTLAAPALLILHSQPNAHGPTVAGAPLSQRPHAHSPTSQPSLTLAAPRRVAAHVASQGPHARSPTLAAPSSAGSRRGRSHQPHVHAHTAHTQIHREGAPLIITINC